MLTIKLSFNAAKMSVHALANIYFRDHLKLNDGVIFLGTVSQRPIQSVRLM